MTGAEAACLRAVVRGRVQGVGFRWFVVERARFLDLVGWVRNTPSGTVEVLAEGPRGALEGLLDELRQGPASSHVTKVEVGWEPPTGGFAGFEVEPTR